MKIEKVVCSAGRTGFFFDDQKAIKAGAKSDGAAYVGEAMTPGFEKIRLEPGESRTVSFEIERDALSFWNMDMEYVCDPGEFEVFIGPDSTTENKASFVLM